MSIFGKLTNSDKKNEAIEEFNRLKRRYENLLSESNREVRHLYTKRKKASEAISEAEKIILKDKEVRQEIKDRVVNAKLSIKSFDDCVSQEKAYFNHDNKGTNVSDATAGVIAGATIGTAVSTLGPTAAMAIATTFGTAATGTAISTLSGVAATNAALAWLGGGALAIGGGGMAAGSALLALAGPIGIVIGGGVAAGGIFKARSKNNQLAEEINKQNREISYKCSKIQRCLSEIRKSAKTMDNESNELLKELDKPQKDWNLIAQLATILARYINIKFSI